MSNLSLSELQEQITRLNGDVGALMKRVFGSKPVSPKICIMIGVYLISGHFPIIQPLGLSVLLGLITLGVGLLTND